MIESEEQFKMALEVITQMLLARGNDGVSQTEYRGFVHVATACMMDSFESGMSGSGTPDLIAKMESLDNPLAEAISSAMRWSYTQGQKAR